MTGRLFIDPGFGELDAAAEAAVSAGWSQEISALHGGGGEEVGRREALRQPRGTDAKEFVARLSPSVRQSYNMQLYMEDCWERDKQSDYTMPIAGACILLEAHLVDVYVPVTNPVKDRLLACVAAAHEQTRRSVEGWLRGTPPTLGFFVQLLIAWRDGCRHDDLREHLGRRFRAEYPPKLENKSLEQLLNKVRVAYRNASVHAAHFDRDDYQALCALLFGRESCWAWNRRPPVAPSEGALLHHHIADLLTA